MIFILKLRSDRIGSLFLSILYQIYYCKIHNYFIHINDISKLDKYKTSIYLQSILNIIKEHNKKIKVTSKHTVLDKININGPGIYDLCYGMGKIVQDTQCDMLTYFKNNFNNDIVCDNYNIPFDINNSIVIHLRLDDTTDKKDYDGSICSSYYINLINNSKETHYTNLPPLQKIIPNGFEHNTQNPLSPNKIKKQLDILLSDFPNSKVIIIASPLTKIPKISFKYDMLIQSQNYEYDLYLLTMCKKIILSRSNFALMALFFGNHTHIHMPLWGHFACAGFGTKYDKCKFKYFY
jgi:hypothetical protein